MYFIPYDKDLKEYSRMLRKNLTLGEILVWNELKAKRTGYSFNRQKPLNRYIVDFYCKELNLVIEIDGSSHFFDEVAVKDSYRQRILNEMGLTLLRFTEHDACKNRSDILRNIEAYIFDFEEKQKSK